MLFVIINIPTSRGVYLAMFPDDHVGGMCLQRTALFELHLYNPPKSREIVLVEIKLVERFDTIFAKLCVESLQLAGKQNPVAETGFQFYFEYFHHLECQPVPVPP